MKKSTISFSLRVFRRYMFFLSSQRWDRKKIDEYQDRKLINIVRHAAEHVPYYRNLFKEVNLDPYKFRGREDMQRIPMLDKQTLRIRQDEFIADNASQYGISWDSTSGSTGTPLHFIEDNLTKASKLAVVLRSYQWAGYLPGKKTFSLQSYTFGDPASFTKYFPFAKLWRFDAKKLKKETALELLDLIDRERPSVFIGYPFSIFMLTQFAEREGRSIHPIGSIVTAGETLSERRRELLEAAYKCKVYDFFSHHENVAIITECKNQTRHICEDFAYNEIVDESGNDASEKGTGELVGTGFYNYAMPLIRYRIGDKVILDSKNDACGCGRHFRIVKEIVGRQNDYLETPDGRLLGNVLEHSVDNAKGVMLSQCVQDAIDHMYVNLIVEKEFNEESRIELEKGLRKRLGNEIKIDFKVVSQLERSKSGKTPFIISRIGHEYV
jgi:phenylacetate-CoA ligase